MKKKIILCFAFTFCISLASVFGRRYEDKKNGYSGLAMATYLGTIKEIDDWGTITLLRNNHEMDGHRTRDCEKLSKAESFLMWSALEEYNFKKNEVYNILIFEGYDYLVLTVTITGKDTLEWYGFYYY